MNKIYSCQNLDAINIHGWICNILSISFREREREYLVSYILSCMSMHYVCGARLDIIRIVAICLCSYCMDEIPKDYVFHDLSIPGEFHYVLYWSILSKMVLEEGPWFINSTRFSLNPSPSSSLPLLSLLLPPLCGCVCKFFSSLSRFCVWRDKLDLCWVDLWIRTSVRLKGYHHLCVILCRAWLK